VLRHVVTGLMNKQIAHLLGLSEITVKIHRGSMMRKMGAASVADLVRKAGLLGVGPEAGQTPMGQTPAGQTPTGQTKV
jgi:DNA-binding NarL/FixJ family response regulator